LAKGLKTHHQFSADYLQTIVHRYWTPRHGDGASSNGIILQGQQNILRTNIQNYINYNFSTKGHNVYLTAGQELTQTQPGSLRHRDQILLIFFT